MAVDCSLVICCSSFNVVLVCHVIADSAAVHVIMQSFSAVRYHGGSVTCSLQFCCPECGPTIYVHVLLAISSLVWSEIFALSSDLTSLTIHCVSKKNSPL